MDPIQERNNNQSQPAYMNSNPSQVLRGGLGIGDYHRTWSSTRRDQGMPLGLKDSVTHAIAHEETLLVQVTGVHTTEIREQLSPTDITLSGHFCFTNPWWLDATTMNNIDEALATAHHITSTICSNSSSQVQAISKDSHTQPLRTKLAKQLAGKLRQPGPPPLPSHLLSPRATSRYSTLPFSHDRDLETCRKALDTYDKLTQYPIRYLLAA
ncbi:hypothetical protein B0O80DRAFT_2368 [Mortierella sp. GBAus27b]|nr:hypothetical protein B0O80DRAFT_2368 [Mortierella sp. GBAus27b]